ncbi:MAG: GDP-L-fucose synthase [Pseudomonadota bacterium]|nr:GDP-L-fucose synthase [Pseudomonadota bacterium]
MSDTKFELSGRRVWVAGHRGMVGSALMRLLKHYGCVVLTASRSELDLRRQVEVEQWMGGCKPEVVIIAAATVGGILANDTQPADFLYDNLAIETNIIHASHALNVKKLMLLGSTCIYPRLAEQPIKETALLTGALEPTNQWYAIAKIAGIKLCDAYRKQFGCSFISAQPTNLYGPGDNFDLDSSHVLPALMRKIHEGKKYDADWVDVWGTGAPLREFLHVDDLARALLFLIESYDEVGHVNIGSGEEISIAELAKMIAATVGYKGEFRFLSEKPDGTPRKLADTTKLNNLGWNPEISLVDGLRSTYKWYTEEYGLGSKT